MAEKAKVSELDKNKVSQRDSTLIMILERLTDQIHKQDMQLEIIIKHKDELLKIIESTEFRRGALQSEADISFKKVHDALSRYRSDMIDLVKEQDNINKCLEEMRKLIKNTALALESNNKRLEVIDERSKSMEKTDRAHYELSLKQAEILPIEIADASRNYTKLHTETDRIMGKMHHETVKELEKMQNETLRRLLALDGIEAALQTILTRTEPPEKKPFFVIKIFRKLVSLFRIKIPSAIRKKRLKS